MKRLSRFDKVIYFLNVVAIFLLLIACIAPFIQSKNLSFLSFVGLGVPALIITHILFVLYWVLRRKRKFYGSLLVLLISYFSLGTFYKWNSPEQPKTSDLKIMSFNVRLFNKFNELESTTVIEDTKAFVRKENPDIICIQESYYNSGEHYKNYPYRYLPYLHMEGKGMLAIFSKYPIINTSMLNLPRTSSNALFADIKYKNDTIRVYNIHLESLGITPGHGVLRKEASDKLFKQVSNSFQKQMVQANVVGKHLKTSPYKNILCGDFNNGQYSNVYHTIKGNLQDSYLEEGSGFGRSYIFHGLPFRIDFIFADDAFEVKSHVNYDVEYSDHFPVMASFELSAD